MIGKLSMGAGAAGAISYCYYEKHTANGEKLIRGELLYSNELYLPRLTNGHLDIKSLAWQFGQVAELNTRTEKFIWHQTFNFPPTEKVNNETMVKIARDFARDFGFEHNQYLVFRHRDKPHEHFHIIANRINPHGKNTAIDKHNFERIQQFCRKMEEKYGLSVTENPSQKCNQENNRKNAQADRLKGLIDAQIPYSRSLSELSIALKKKGIIIHLSRGISFTDRKYGFTFKGSELGRNYSRSSIEKRLDNAKTAAVYQTSRELVQQNSFQDPLPLNSNIPTRMINISNNEGETRKDLAKIRQSLSKFVVRKRPGRKLR